MRGSSNGGANNGSNNNGGRGGYHHMMGQVRPANSMDQDSFDSFDDVEETLVLPTNQLRLSPNSGSNAANNAGGNASSGGEEAPDELPKSVIVTNVDLSVFDRDEVKANFESLFREVESTAVFHYLRSFRRIRVDFESHLSASKAKVTMDNTLVGEKVIHCYFIQVLSPSPGGRDAYLGVPPLEKQFLISPPCSPPVGWEQPREDRPVVDYDLLAAMAQLAPGEKHELHPTKQINVLGKSVSTPSIVVHIAEDAADGVPGLRIPACGLGRSTGVATAASAAAAHTGRIRQTRCPDRQSSLD